MKYIHKAKLVGPSNPLSFFDICEECDACVRLVGVRGVNLTEELQVLKENIYINNTEEKYGIANLR